ncbi:hypothetical protein [Prosthecobacter sp.]|uniref:hypothetical protein n=1 Tax=Prosthecobacter sp. TaxID=1965333 RepID=UPI001DF3A385|nr:hypothetical protein [Prosthecobacter sp.]MCB1276419.1 hypothetical protein [Prosthecobacter sp.]
MLSKSRLFLAVAACVLLSNCGLINTALRLAPYALFFADEQGAGSDRDKPLELRGQQVNDKGVHGTQPMETASGAKLALKR